MRTRCITPRCENHRGAMMSGVSKIADRNISFKGAKINVSCHKRSYEIIKFAPIIPGIRPSCVVIWTERRRRFLYVKRVSRAFTENKTGDEAEDESDW